jgi:hypothetical protein
MACDMSRPRYQSYRFYSPVLGSDAVRFLMFDKHGDEHFAIVPMDRRGSRNRYRREKALETLLNHVFIRDLDPTKPAGEVEVNLLDEEVQT